jgi:mono/diheme cytochrome c family protein
MLKKIKYFVLIVVSAITLVPFQNCGNQWVLREPSQSLDMMSQSCEAELAQIFDQSFYPFLRQNCASCHTEGGPGMGHFADPVEDKAWSDFNSIGAHAVIRNATNDKHKPPYTGSKHAAYLNLLKEQWDQAVERKKECESQKAGANPLDTPFVTKSQRIPNLSNTAWTIVTWDLYSQALKPPQQNIVAAQFRIEMRNFLKNGSVVGYEFRNPHIRLTGLQPYQFESLYFLINNTKARDLTMYAQIKKTISVPDEWMSLIDYASNGFIVTDVIPNSEISIEFSKIQIASGGSDSGGSNGDGSSSSPPSPLPNVTLVELLSMNPSVNVFQASCVSCHRASNARGGLDITDPAEARQYANTILSRMKNSSRPMPPSGLLPADRVRIVEGWVANGAK